MSNLSPELIAQLYAQESGDPFLTLITLNHPTFTSPIRLVNNSVNIVSRGNTFLAFPMKIRLPADDGETSREFQLEMDNVSLQLIESVRSITTSMDMTLEMILASIPDEVQISIDELKVHTITYNKTKIVAKVALDNFLNVEMTSERYGPQNFPGLF